LRFFFFCLNLPENNPKWKQHFRLQADMPIRGQLRYCSSNVQTSTQNVKACLCKQSLPAGGYFRQMTESQEGLRLTGLFVNRYSAPLMMITVCGFLLLRETDITRIRNAAQATYESDVFREKSVPYIIIVLDDAVVPNYFFFC
jgi:hypothetical protein